MSNDDFDIFLKCHLKRMRKNPPQLPAIVDFGIFFISPAIALLAAKPVTDALVSEFNMSMKLTGINIPDSNMITVLSGVIIYFFCVSLLFLAAEELAVLFKSNERADQNNGIDPHLVIADNGARIGFAIGLIPGILLCACDENVIDFFYQIDASDWLQAGAGYISIVVTIAAVFLLLGACVAKAMATKGCVELPASYSQSV